MGLLDKIKNTFFEEEYVEVEEKPKKESKKKVKINNYDEEEVKEKKSDSKITEVKEEKDQEVEEEIKLEEVKKPEVFGYFDEDDFLDFEEEKEKEEEKEPIVKEESKIESYSSKIYENNNEVKKPYGGATVKTTYQSSPFQKSEGKKFTPTPIISPIYGVLDKNYTKDEIEFKKEKKASSYVSRKNADLDSVRKKAFGSSIKDDFGLTDEEDEIEVKEVEVENVNPEIEDDNLLYDMTDNYKKPSVDTVTLQDAEEYFDDLGLEYNVDYKDTKLEKATGRRVKKKKLDMTIEEEPEIVEEENDDIFDEIGTFDIEDEVVSEEDDADTSTSTSVEDNLFDLIDSMYEEEQ